MIDLNCPQCKKDDNVQKASAIVEGETYNTSGRSTTSGSSSASGTNRHYTSDGDYHGRSKVSSTSYNTSMTQIQATQQSHLAHKLSPPQKPKLKTPGCLSTLFGGNTIETERRKHDVEMKYWEQAIERWQKVFYCRRCDLVYIPNEDININLDNFLTILYDVESYQSDIFEAESLGELDDTDWAEYAPLITSDEGIIKLTPQFGDIEFHSEPTSQPGIVHNVENANKILGVHVHENNWVYVVCNINGNVIEGWVHLKYFLQDPKEVIRYFSA